MNRELDLKIAKEVMNWNVYEHIGPDAFGENECDVLVPHKGYLEYMAINGYTPPVKGKIPEGFFVPQYSGQLDIALDLARFVKLPLQIWELPNRPEEIAWLCYEHFKKDESPDPQTESNLEKSAELRYPYPTKIDSAEWRIDEIIDFERRAWVEGAKTKAARLKEMGELLMKKDGEIEGLKAAIENAMKVMTLEINPSNYNHDDVCELNSQSCQAYNILKAAVQPS